MKTVFFTSDKHSFARVYGENARLLQERYGAPARVCNKADLVLAGGTDAEILFSTWGMESFTAEEIRRYFPNLKFLFYAAGSVKHFARAFLESGVRVFCAQADNAIPVADFIVSAIVLSLKGGLRAVATTKRSYRKSADYARQAGGVYNAKIGLIGAGAIGTLVAQKLKGLGAFVFCHDPYLTEERALSLGVVKMDLSEIFAECDAISNHLPDWDALAGILNYRLFSQMKPYAAFVNTGRGRQVNEKDLVKAMRKVPTRTALLDVSHPEPPSLFSPLRYTKNIYLTPHIAGSTGREVIRMSASMVQCCQDVLEGKETPHEITLQILETKA